jgi:hypothetical protein
MSLGYCHHHLGPSFWNGSNEQPLVSLYFGP